MIRLLFFPLILFNACAPRPNQGEQKWAEIVAVHEEALSISRAVKPQIQELDQQRIRINVQGRALTEPEMHFVAEVEKLLARFGEWDSNRPGLPPSADQFKGNLQKLKQSHTAYRDTILAIKNSLEALKE